MSSLREQFEAWFKKEHTVAPSTALIRSKLNQDEYACMSVQSEWQAYQAGHAASGRDDLLEALEQCLEHIELNETSESSSVVAQVARAAIKKARGEA